MAQARAESDRQMTGTQLNIRKVAGSLGAEVSGIDLGQPLDGDTKQAVHDALMNHQVLFFRDQDITPEQHVAFGQNFGTLQVHPMLPRLDEQPEVLILESFEGRRSAANLWHSDVTFDEEPPLGSVLLARKVPDFGGDTMWANMYEAYEALTPAMKRYLDGMTALHSAGKAKFEEIDAHDTLDHDGIKKKRASMAPAEHPVVRTHPVTGRKALFVNSVFTLRLRGVPRKESEAILNYLYDHINTPEFSCRFDWQPNSVAFWDNRCTQHYAVADYGGSHRLMHRVTINGDRPV